MSEKNKRNTRYTLDNQFYVEMYINDEPMYYDPSTFEEFSIVQNTINLVPSFKFIINGEATGRFSNFYNPGDLNKIDVEIGNARSGQRIINSRWRMFGSPKYESSGNNSERITVLCILDVIKYFRSMVQNVPEYNGNLFINASDAIRWITNSCNLETTNYSGENTIDQTNDKQYWLPRRNTFCSFAHDICNHSWINDQSIFSLALDEERTLFFKNISELAKKNPKTQFLHTKSQKIIQNTHGVLDYEIKNFSGMLNNWAAYHLKSTQEKISGNFDEFSDINIVRQSNYFEVGKEIDKEIDENRVIHRPIETKNTHENFENALHQNKRGRTFYGTFVDVLVEDITENDLYDVIRLDLIEPVSRETNTSNKTYSGNYIISAKTRIIKGTRYYEKLRLATQGRMLDNFEREK